jgi:lysocardiolipin and lysophospholipid acyltransferase
MLQQLVSIVLLIIWYIYISYTYLTPAIIIKEEKIINNIIKQSFQIISSYVIEYGFNPKIFYNKKIILTPGKIDILIANHNNIIDGFLIIHILKHMGITKWACIGKKEIMYVPGIGLNFLFDDHIKLSRKWEEDKLKLEKQLDYIKEGLIIIFPEGTRFTIDKWKEGQKYSRDNNYPIYDNLLVPKTKGLLTMLNYLKKNNKFGKIFDLSIVYEKFHKSEATNLNILGKLEDIYLITRELDINIDTNLENNFKPWLLNIWKEKDILFNYYKDVVYTEMKFNHDKIVLFTNILICITISYQLYENKYFRYYLIISIIIAYILTYIESIKKN